MFTVVLGLAVKVQKERVSDSLTNGPGLIRVSPPFCWCLFVPTASHPSGSRSFTGGIVLHGTAELQPKLPL
jgi:hypothetical protein